MIGDQQLTEVRKLFSADSPATNWAREEIEEKVSELLDLSTVGTLENVPAQEIALEVKARKCAAEKVREIFNHLGFALEESTRQDRKVSWR